MKDIVLKPLGVIRSPYKNAKDIPIQGRFKENVEAYAEVDKKYEDGLIDLDEFSHAILIYHFDQCIRETIKGKPYLEEKEHGVFAIRSPYRPNHVGFSIVKIKKIEKNRLYFTEVDMFDNTPIIDIKPYVKHFDSRDNVKSGWVDKHFENNTIPKQTILKEENDNRNTN
ncbi:MAG: tRNA (N6-threonylcarbamoyladenosine(37)-N6)-methyltransferase TrmO [Bacteroidota bacterium]